MSRIHAGWSLVGSIGSDDSAPSYSVNGTSFAGRLAIIVPESSTALPSATIASPDVTGDPGPFKPGASHTTPTIRTATAPAPARRNATGCRPPSPIAAAARSSHDAARGSRLPSMRRHRAPESNSSVGRPFRVRKIFSGPLLMSACSSERSSCMHLSSSRTNTEEIPKPSNVLRLPGEPTLVTGQRGIKSRLVAAHRSVLIPHPGSLALLADGRPSRERTERRPGGLLQFLRCCTRPRRLRAGTSADRSPAPLPRGCRW